MIRSGGFRGIVRGRKRPMNMRKNAATNTPRRSVICSLGFRKSSDTSNFATCSSGSESGYIQAWRPFNGT